MVVLETVTFTSRSGMYNLFTTYVECEVSLQDRIIDT